MGFFGKKKRRWNQKATLWQRVTELVLLSGLNQNMKKVWKIEMFWFFTLKLLVSKLFSVLFLNSPFSTQIWNIKCRDPWVIRATQTRHTAGVYRTVACSFPAVHPYSQIHLIWVWQVLVDWFSFLLEHVSLLDFLLKVLTQQVSIIIKSEAGYFSVWLGMFCSLCALKAVGGWSQGGFWQAPNVCAVGRAATVALSHGSYPWRAWIQQISNSTSGSGAVQAMPKSSVELKCK